MAFDPDAYLAAGAAPAVPAAPAQAPAFNPDAFLAPKPEAPFSDRAALAVRKFFDPGYGSNEPAGLGNVARQAVKAGAFLVPGTGAASLLASGALYGAGDSDAKDATGIAWDAAKGSVGALVGGKVLQKVGGALVNATAWPSGRGAAMAQELFDAGSQPIIKLVRGPAGVTAAPAAAAATTLTTEPAVGAFPRLVTGTVTPTPSAQTLMANGVRLTRAQQDPASSMNQLEQAMTSTWPFGSRLKSQRGIGPQDLQIAALNQSLPPGVKPVKVGTDFATAMDEVATGFDKAYGSVGDFPVYPAIHGKGGGPLQGTTNKPGMVESAVDAVKRLTDSQRGAVKADVLDLLSQLPPRKGAVGQIGSGDLINLRSTVRARAREYRADHSAESSAVADAYDSVTDAITAALESQLPAQAAAKLRATDAAYRNFKVVDAATIAARSQPDGFTARQLAAAASKGQSGRNIGGRDAGPLYDLGIAGSDVFRQVSQPTGERLITLSDAGHFLPGPVRNLLVGGAISKGNTAAMSAVPVRVPRALPQMSVNPAAAGTMPDIPGMVPGAVAPPTTDALRALYEALRKARLGLAPAGAEEAQK